MAIEEAAGRCLSDALHPPTATINVWLPFLAGIETALSFCRGVMGYGDAQIINDGREIGHTFETYKGQRGACTGFFFMDLNIVVKEVRQWCEMNSSPQRPLTFSLTYNAHGEYLGEICDWLEPLHERTLCTSPCHALMQACLEAQRKLKEAA